MSDYEPTEVQADALPGDTMLVGIDEKDDVHRYSRRENTVYVGRVGADLMDAYDLDTYPLADVRDIEGWVALVDSRRGWTECRYVKNVGEWLSNMRVREAV